MMQHKLPLKNLRHNEAKYSCREVLSGFPALYTLPWINAYTLGLLTIKQVVLSAKNHHLTLFYTFTFTFASVMRLWSLHPKYLDAKGLVALWREGLLAQNVLAGNTKGYKNHPQLIRFREYDNPILAIGTYLFYVQQESIRRGYHFDITKIHHSDSNLKPLSVTDGQLVFELTHLRNKLAVRDPVKLGEIEALQIPEPHPSFFIIKGDIAHWERI